MADRRGRWLAGFVFLREVDGTWSPRGDGLFVNNYDGSNFADCLVAKNRRGHYRLESLARIFERQRSARAAMASRLHIAAAPGNSHFYLTCDRWRGNDSVDVEIHGYRDDGPQLGPEFSYRLRFSAATGRLELR